MMTLADHDATQPDQEAKIVSAFQTRCETDKWSDDARSCMATTQNPAEEDGCAKMMTPAQTTALADARATLAGAPPKTEAAAPDAEESTAHTRGAVKKKAAPPKGKSKTSDPCEGGE
jgi:hypothetical protein